MYIYIYIFFVHIHIYVCIHVCMYVCVCFFTLGCQKLTQGKAMLNPEELSDPRSPKEQQIQSDCLGFFFLIVSFKD